MTRTIHTYVFTILLLIAASGTVFSQDVQVIGVEELESLIHEDNGKTKVINFWATWCKPCIEELPHFEALNQDPMYESVEVTLISLDFVEDLDDKVKKFIAKRALTSTVMLMDNVDYNSWIDKVDPSWSGAIPATLVINNSARQREFHEKQFEGDELKKVIADFTSRLNQTNQ